MLTFTVREADRLDLGVDMSMCSGWNFGGPNVPREHGGQQAVVGGCRSRWPINSTPSRDAVGGPDRTFARRAAGGRYRQAHARRPAELAAGRVRLDALRLGLAADEAGGQTPGPGRRGMDAQPVLRRRHEALPGAVHRGLRGQRGGPASGHAARLLRVLQLPGIARSAQRIRRPPRLSLAGPVGSPGRIGARRYGRPGKVRLPRNRFRPHGRECLSGMGPVVPPAAHARALPGPRLAGQLAQPLRPGRHPRNRDVRPRQAQPAGIAIRRRHGQVANHRACRNRRASRAAGQQVRLFRGPLGRRSPGLGGDRHLAGRAFLRDLGGNEMPRGPDVRLGDQPRGLLRPYLLSRRCRLARLVVLRLRPR